jgi:undecaprenyl-diphosphatase
MSIIEAIILGIIQGLTEFLPVSSSGHLELAKAIMGDASVGEESMLMTVVLHFATALSTVIIFRKEIVRILKGLFQFKWNEEFKFAIKIVLSMIPAALVGVFLNDEIEALFGGQIMLVGFMLLLTGALLFLADKAKNTNKDVSFTHSIIIGISQAIAILPGISRSGATISTSVLLGIDREKAARFSFLMVVPLIFGKIAKDIKDGAFENTDMDLLPLGIGFLFAFVTGMIACTWMISIVKKSKLKYFAFYCFVVGFLAIGYTFLN